MVLTPEYIHREHFKRLLVISECETIRPGLLVQVHQHSLLQLILEFKQALDILHLVMRIQLVRFFSTMITRKL